LTSFAGLHFENLPGLTELDAAEDLKNSQLCVSKMLQQRKQNSQLSVSKTRQQGKHYSDVNRQAKNRLCFHATKE